MKAAGLDPCSSHYFNIEYICVQSILTLTGTNVVTVHRNIELTNRQGGVGQNSGVSLLRIEGGKVAQVKDFMFDLGENFRLNWSAA